jgi:hypothetical protein
MTPRRSWLSAIAVGSRRPYRQANRLPPQLEAVIVRLKRDYPDWGAPKIREKLRRQAPASQFPPSAPSLPSSTVGPSRSPKTPLATVWHVASAQHLEACMYALPPLTAFDCIGAAMGECLFVLFMSLVKEPTRYTLNVIIVAGATRACLSVDLVAGSSSNRTARAMTRRAPRMDADGAVEPAGYDAGAEDGRALCMTH